MLKTNTVLQPNSDLVWFPLNSTVRMEDTETGILKGWVSTEGAVGVIRSTMPSSTRWVVQDEGLAAAIRRTEVGNRLRSSAPFNEAVMLWLAQTAENAMHTAASNVREGAFDRIARLLKQLSHGRLGQPISINQAEIARMTGLQRTTVSGAMSQMRLLGMVKYSRGTVTVSEPSLLSAA